MMMPRSMLWMICVLACAMAARASVAEAITKAGRIRPGEAGALVVDGRKIFPITLTIVPGPEATTPEGEQADRQFREAG